MAEEQESRLERLVELCLYAPIGLAFETADLVPRLIERGRGQVGLLRFAADMAVKRESQRWARPESDEPSTYPSAPSAAPRAVGAVEPAPGADLPIPDYDDKTAADIVGLLDGLDDEGLDSVARHEAATRGRVTILNKIKRLRS